MIPYVPRTEHFRVYDATGAAYPLPSVQAPEPALIGTTIRPQDTREGWLPLLVARRMRLHPQ